MKIEAVLLTGGASRRMGEDKASMAVQGFPQAQRIANALIDGGYSVTVLGKKSVEGCAFLEDEQEFAGPLAALGRFVPTADAVLAASCDLVRFDARVVGLLGERLKGYDVAVPEIAGRLQPLCALYASSALAQIEGLLGAGKRSVMSWIDALEQIRIGEDDLLAASLDPLCVNGANTREEFGALAILPSDEKGVG